MALLQEENPRWVKILHYLADHGARSGKGCRIGQHELAAKIGCNERTLHEYMVKMEAHGILKIRRTTVDGSFGSPRGYNIYHLTCTIEHWENVLGPAVIAERLERRHKMRSAIARNFQKEQRRKRLQAQLDELTPPAAFKPARAARAAIGQPPAPARLPDAEVELLATAFDGIVDDELVGW